ncbi:MAG: hypothetical protein J6U16_07855 [Ruminococcus sp.]|nr:hypothetical protein [Ruminococcus sp.]
MTYTKKLFGGIDMTWKRLLILSVAAGVISGGLLCIPFLEDTSFTDNGASYEWWIFLAIIIITNCKKPLEAACKTFVFFLISQPLIYLVQVPFCWLHWGIFSYYPPWFLQTLLTFPGAFLGWFVTKKKWYSLLILSPMLALLALTGMGYLHGVLYQPPWHLLTVIFCAAVMFVLVFGIFEDKKLRAAGCILNVALLGVFFFMSVYGQPHAVSNICPKADSDAALDPNVNYTAVSSDEDVVRLHYEEKGIPQGWQAEFYKRGTAQLTFTGDDGSVLVYDVSFGDNFDINFKLAEKKTASPEQTGE